MHLAVLHDLAKVVIDGRKNKNADKGGFEIAYRAKNEVLRPKNNMTCDLKVDGTCAGSTTTHIGPKLASAAGANPTTK